MRTYKQEHLLSDTGGLVVSRFGSCAFALKVWFEPGCRLSKTPITYLARKAIFNDLFLKKKAVIIIIIIIMIIIRMMMMMMMMVMVMVMVMMMKMMMMMMMMMIMMMMMMMMMMINFIMCSQN